MLIIIGLGNPGLTYRNTYHNTGFNTVDKLVASWGDVFKRRVCRAKVCEHYVSGEKIVVAKPQTYMNLSGGSVRELMGYYHASPCEMVVVYDDIDLDLGVLRMREKGSAGTHNGMRSVVGCIGEDIPRLRIGIGRPTGEMPLYDFVLSRPKGETFATWDAATTDGANVLEAYVRTRSVAASMQILR
jgi:PTH1 family peptidyl-tRNA hydrolase